MDIQWTTSIQKGFPALVETLQFETTELPGNPTVKRQQLTTRKPPNQLQVVGISYWTYVWVVLHLDPIRYVFLGGTLSLASSCFTFFWCSSRHLGLPMPRTARLSKGPWWLTIPEAAFLLMVCESSYTVVAIDRTIPQWKKSSKEVSQPSQVITQISSMNSILGWGILGWKPGLDTHVSLCLWLSVLVRLR